MDFSHYKLRCSILPHIIGKKALTETAKGLLKDIYITEKYNRKKILNSKYLSKGNEKEDDSISLYRKVNQLFTKKNEEQFENKFLTGTPDLIITRGRSKSIIDIKTCWDIWTYVKKDIKTADKDYFWQLAGYSMLTGIKKVRIAYTLLNNTDYEIYRQYEQAKWSLGIMEDGTEDTSEQLLELEEKIRYNNTYDDIPAKDRVKTFDFEVTDEHYFIIEEFTKLSRNYLNGLSL